MYKDFFGLTDLPFSIVPSARFLFLSGRHKEALAHLQAGLGDGGGFALLTGEVGTGKTTVSRALLSQLDDNVKPGLILNPTFTVPDLLGAICDEFKISYPEQASLKQFTDAIYQYLLANHAKGIQTLVIIDEAQHLTPDVLEQLRLLTNLETDSRKLLKVLLIGQPELQQRLQQENLRQLAQRITARYHLLPLSVDEVESYISYRLSMAGQMNTVFTLPAIKGIAVQTGGIPRLINLVCDKAMLYSYHRGSHEVDRNIAEQACHDVLSWQSSAPVMARKSYWRYVVAGVLGLSLMGTSHFYLSTLPTAHSVQPQEALSVLEVPAELVVDESISDGIPPEILSEPEIPMASYIQSSRRSVLAMQTLLKVWGFEASLLEANCENSSRAQLYCYQGQGDLLELQVLNRPAVLTLYEEHKPFFAVLYAVNDESIELLLAEQRIEVPLSWLEERWIGEYQLLWRSPLSEQRVLRVGAQSEDVLVLDKLLSSVVGGTVSSIGAFDQKVKEKVQLFQRWQGLIDDGIVGPRTLMALDSSTNPDAPTLTEEL